MLWLIGGMLGLVLLIATSVGVNSQPFARWWFAGKDARTIPVALPTEQPRSTPSVVSTTPVPVVSVPTVTVPRILDVIDIAKTWLGVRYEWGGCTHRGVDCSCFLVNVFREVGIQMPRTTVEQIRWATPISASDATAGDLVFFDNTCTGCGANPTHVALYLGNGQIIDAGDPVKIEPMFVGHNARFGRVHP